MSLVTPAKIDVDAAKTLHESAVEVRQDLDELIPQIGPTVSEVRRVLDLAIATVADNAGVAPGRYRAIEQGELTPTIDEIVALTDWMHRAAQGDEQALKPPTKPEPASAKAEKPAKPTAGQLTGAADSLVATNGGELPDVPAAT